jgi:hypothetical protein
MSERVLVTSTKVPISELKPHPRNPRKGNVGAIVDSLEFHGQYRPIVAQTSTGYILAGNHTFLAAKELGWDSVAVSWLDVDDATGERIMVADNRTSDLASYNNDALADLLHSLPDLDGTGFTRLDLDELDGLFEDTPEPVDKPISTPKPKATISIGSDQLWVDEQPLQQWLAPFEGLSKKEVVQLLSDRLGFPEPAKPEKVTRRSPERISGNVETVNIDYLQPYNGNAREGDIGAISESLRHLGQFRPVVVQRSTNLILVGNHTWRAAKHLGWKRIAVAWVEVDDEQAKRIVLVDNRTADLSGYDDNNLIALLTNLSSLDGTGFSGDDLDDLLNDVKSDRDHRPTKDKTIRCSVDKYSWKVPTADYIKWSTEMGDINRCTIIAQRLALPEGSWTSENPK